MTAPTILDRPRAASPRAPHAGPVEPVVVCAEYLALQVARRNGWGPSRADDLAELVGHVAGLLRGADHHAIEARAALLRGVTGWGIVS